MIRWAHTAALGLLFVACKPIEAPREDAAYRQKFFVQACPNSFCVRSDPQVERRHRKLESMGKRRPNAEASPEHEDATKPQRHGRGAPEFPEGDPRASRLLQTRPKVDAAPPPQRGPTTRDLAPPPDAHDPLAPPPATPPANP